jgi:ribonuclease HI
MRVYTDGSCLGTPGPGGWAWAVDRETYGRGSEPETTNQRMELMAVVQALESLPEYVPGIVIVSDSAYIVNCFLEGWHEGWTADGHRRRDGKPVSNWDLWTRIFSGEISGFDVEFEKVKGHSGDVMNDFVDSLARGEAEREKHTMSKRGALW